MKCSISDIAIIERKTISATEIKPGTKYLGLEHIEKDTGRILEFIPVEKGELASNKFVFTDKHVLLGKLRPYLNKVAIPDFSGICSTDIFPIKPIAVKVEKYFLAYILRQKAFVEYATSRSSGANLPRINAQTILDYKVNLPALPEQRRIANLLSRAEAALEKRREAMRLADEFLKSVFLEMFGDPVRNEKRWKIYDFHSTGTIDRGVSKHRPRNAPQLLGGPYPLIQTGEIANSTIYIREYKQTYSEIGLKQSKMWPKGTLCITIAANIGKVGILSFEACFPDSVVGYLPNKNMTAEYVLFWLLFIQKRLEDSAPESAQKNINLNILRNLKIPVPPFELQSKFAGIIAQSEKLKEKQHESEKELENLFGALMQK